VSPTVMAVQNSAQPASVASDRVKSAVSGASPAAYQCEVQDGQAEMIAEIIAQIALQSGIDRSKAQDQHGLGPGLGKASASERLERPA